MICDEELSKILKMIEDDLQDGCGRLIDRANAEGGADNITVILARVA